MAKTKFKNLSRGARGVYDDRGELHMVEPGAEISLDVSDQELKDQRANAFFSINGKRPRAAGEDDELDVAEEGAPASVLDQSVAKLKEHLETVDSIDDLNGLGAQEASGQNRDGALKAIQARIEELQKGEE